VFGGAAFGVVDLGARQQLFTLAHEIGGIGQLAQDFSTGAERWVLDQSKRIGPPGRSSVVA
jgi:hypothetical protein